MIINCNFYHIRHGVLNNNFCMMSADGLIIWKINATILPPNFVFFTDRQDKLSYKLIKCELMP